MEAALVNVLSPGDRDARARGRSFGERWAAIGKAHGMDVKVAERRARRGGGAGGGGEGPRRDPAIRAVFVQLSESSTGAAHDVEALARIVRGHPETVLVVDAISGAGAMRLETEAWGLDVVVVGSQKALALPPGLAFVSVSAKGWERIESARAPRFYFDLRRERKAQAGGETAFTPAISHVIALKAALDFVESVGGVDGLVRNAGAAGGLHAGGRGGPGPAPAGPAGPRRRAHRALPAGGPRGRRHRQGAQGGVRSTVAGGQGDAQGEDLPGRPPGLLRRDRHPGPAGDAGDRAAPPGAPVRAGHGRGGGGGRVPAA